VTFAIAGALALIVLVAATRTVRRAAPAAFSSSPTLSLDLKGA
jgi:hypothetical protein